MSSIAQMIIAEAQRQGIDPALALEVAQVESGLNPSAVSPKGAVGVFQLMPGTAGDLGVANSFDAQQNIRGGIAYLRQLLGQFGDPSAALAAYNWGPGNVSAAIAQYGSDFSMTTPQGTIPAWLASAPASVRNYVRTILGNVSTQYSVVAAATGAAAGVATPGGGTSTLVIPPPSPAGLLPGVFLPPSPTALSWGTVALVVGMIFGIGLVLNNA